MRGHLAQDAHLAGELGEHRGGAVALAAGRGREPLAHLALHHRDPQLARRAAPRSTSAARSPRRRRAGSPRPCRAPARASAKSSFDRVGEVQRRVVERRRARRAAAARASGPPPPRAGAPPAARGTRDSTPRPPPTSSTTSAASSSAARADHAAGCCRRSGSSGRARGSAGRRTRAGAAGWPGAARSRHQPKHARGVALHRALELLVGDAAQLGHEARGVRRRSPARSACRAPAAAPGTASRSPPAAARPARSRAAAWRSVAFG